MHIFIYIYIYIYIYSEREKTYLLIARKFVAKTMFTCMYIYIIYIYIYIIGATNNSGAL
jgi:hypothetical protein